MSKTLWKQLLPGRRRYAKQARDVLCSVETLLTVGDKAERECASVFENPDGITLEDCDKLKVNRRQAQALIAAHNKLIFAIANNRQRLTRDRQKMVLKFLEKHRQELKDCGWIVHSGFPPMVRSINGTEITFRGGVSSLEDARKLVAKISQSNNESKGGV